MYISRSIITSDRISTNYVEGQYVYERVDFCEWDTFRYGDQYLYSILRNLRTGEVKTQSDFCFWYVEEPGEYELEIQINLEMNQELGILLLKRILHLSH